jgi:hypothetical protein
MFVAGGALRPIVRLQRHSAAERERRGAGSALRPSGAPPRWQGLLASAVAASELPPHNGPCMGKTLLFGKVGRIIVVVHSAREPSDAEWNPYLARLRELPENAVLFVYSVGGVPNSRQRHGLAEQTGGRVLPIAVVAPSRVARAICIAVSWFNPNMQVFSPGYLPDAFAHLRLGTREAAEVVHCARRLAGELGIQRADSDLVVDVPVRQAG